MLQSRISQIRSAGWQESGSSAIGSGSALYHMQYSDVPKLLADVHLLQWTPSLHLNKVQTYQLRARIGRRSVQRLKLLTAH
jgi:hypothetical protein